MVQMPQWMTHRANANAMIAKGQTNQFSQPPRSLLDPSLQFDGKHFNLNSNQFNFLVNLNNQGPFQKQKPVKELAAPFQNPAPSQL